MPHAEPVLGAVIAAGQGMAWVPLLGAVLQAALNAGAPVVLTATGEVVAERAGVLNLGLEGMMLIGALSGFAGATASGSPVVGLLVAMAATAAFSLIHAVLCVTLRANQVVAGLALTMLGAALVSVVGQPLVGKVAPRFESLALPLLSRIPVLGQGLFTHSALVYLAAVAVFGTWFVLEKTRPGLRLQVVGESPESADSLGIRVTLVRYAAVAFGGMLAGAGGAHLSLADTPSWVDGMTSGKGWIAVAMVIFGRWDPRKAALGACLFGGMTAIQLRLQAFGFTLPSFFLSMTPYLLTVALLVLFSISRFQRRFGAPAALGKPYSRE